MPIFLVPVALTVICSLIVFCVFKMIYASLPSVVRNRNIELNAADSRLLPLPDLDCPPVGINPRLPSGKALDRYIIQGIEQISSYLAVAARRGRPDGLAA